MSPLDWTLAVALGVSLWGNWKLLHAWAHADRGIGELASKVLRLLATGNVSRAIELCHVVIRNSPGLS